MLSILSTPIHYAHASTRKRTEHTRISDAHWTSPAHTHTDKTHTHLTARTRHTQLAQIQAARTHTSRKTLTRATRSPAPSRSLSRSRRPALVRWPLGLPLSLSARARFLSRRRAGCCYLALSARFSLAHSLTLSLLAHSRSRTLAACCCAMPAPTRYGVHDVCGRLNFRAGKRAAT